MKADPRPRARVAVDTGVLISHLLLPDSTPGQVVRRAVNEAQLLASDDTLEELAEVLSRSKFDPYLTIGERQEFLRLLLRIVERVPIIQSVQACRDPGDDKFLELAVNGQADVLVTGDKDLLDLDPFRGIPVLTPRAFLTAPGRD